MPAEKLLKHVSARHVATLTLNRPDCGNACDSELLTMLAAALDEAASDPSVRIIVLRGAGTHFCSGADIRAPASDDPQAVRFPEICKQLDEIAKPVVAVIKGGCVGGGVGLAACCDIVIADDAAFFAIPELRVGIAPGALALYFMRAIGTRALRRYLLTGERFTAVTAERLGLVHAVMSQSELDAELARIVDALLLGAPGAAAKAKTAMMKYGFAPIDDAGVQAMEALFREQFASDEAREGRLSFREKRRPNWYPQEKRDPKDSTE